MPVKDTPWGAMRQARAATHTPGSQSGEFRPPKPGFLPPAPPPFSASPIPPVLSSVGITGEHVTYDSLGNNNNNNNNSQHETALTTTATTTTTPPTATNGSFVHSSASTHVESVDNQIGENEELHVANVDNPTQDDQAHEASVNNQTHEVNEVHVDNVDNIIHEEVEAQVDNHTQEDVGAHVDNHENEESSGHVDDHVEVHEESSEYEYYDETDEEDCYAKEAEKKFLEVEEEVTQVIRINGNIYSSEDQKIEKEVKNASDSKTEEAEEDDDDEYEYEDEDEEESEDSEDEEDQCHVEIEEVCDPASCHGLETTDMYDITEAEGDSDNEQLDDPDGLVEDDKLIKTSSFVNEKKIVENPPPSTPDISKDKPIVNESNDVDEEQTKKPTSEEQILDDTTATTRATTETKDQEENEVKVVEEEKEKEVVEKAAPTMSRADQLLLIQFPVGPKIPPFVESCEPCKFHENPTMWIEWLEAEVKAYREKKDEERRKQRKKEMEEERERKLVEEKERKLEEEEKEKSRKEAEKLEREHENAERFEREMERIEQEQIEKERLETENNDKENEHKIEDSQTNANESLEEEVKANDETAKEVETANDEDDGEWEWETESNLEGEQVPAPEKSEEIVENEVKETEHVQKVEEKETIDNTPQILDSTTDKPDTEPAVDENKPETEEEKENNKTENSDQFESSREGRNNDASDPMDVLERIKQFKQTKAYRERHSSTEDPPTPTSTGMPFMRQVSNPERGGRRSRPASLVGDNGLDEMLLRIKKLREERLQILQDMSMIKSAFEQDEGETVADDATTTTTTDNGICNESSASLTGMSTPTSWDDNASSLDPGRSRLHSFDSGISSGNVTIRKKTKRRLPSEEADATEQIRCFICNSRLGRLNKASSVHMGLEDGEPICSDAIHLTDRSRRKIKNIALAKNLDLRAKYELCETLDLDFAVEDSEDITSQEILSRVEHFLDDIELQKERDKEEFESIRMGAIDAIFAAEFANPTQEPEEEAEEDSGSAVVDDQTNKVEEKSEQNAFENLEEESSELTTAVEDIPKPHEDVPLTEARANLLQSIQIGKELKRTSINDKSEPVEAGKVLHKHIAPRAFTRSHRELMQSIDGKVDKSKLNKVKVNDRSAPFIPKDIEIYFYSGPNTDKKAAPPPMSRPVAAQEEGYENLIK